MELTDRKKQILKVVIEDYIHTAEPVGSKTIAVEMGGKISSATIRNELADLVEMGYLTNPEEDVLLNSPDYQDKLVQGFVEGICTYFER